MTEFPDREQVQALIVAALDESIDRCARCKVCDSQINAVMRAVWPLLEGTQARADAAEAKLAEIAEMCRGDRGVLAIIGSEEEGGAVHDRDFTGPVL